MQNENKRAVDSALNGSSAGRGGKPGKDNEKEQVS